MPPKKIVITKQQALEELALRKGLIAQPGQFKLEDYLFVLSSSF